ncbi:hypothetical protein WJX74_003111 [Apatococcus lobatus]|uniref:tRNA-intron lyase n=1 Tax=Apatococcus lobatus TaxID=904363 RepID=A0AAW1QCV9_9CHLO
MDLPQVKRKPRRKQEQPSTAQALHILGLLHLEGSLQLGAVWLVVTPSEAKALRQCALGTIDGGPATAAHILQDAAHSSHSVKDGLADGLSAARMSLEEAFFLAYALECLTVYQAAIKLSEQDLWTACCTAKASFPLAYAGFHHFRSKGWIARSGVQYGTHFVLYQKHPEQAHSDMCAIVTRVGDREMQCWRDLEVANRLCSQVGKKLLLLYVQESPGASTATPAYLTAVQAEEWLLRRWVPERDRA